MDLSGSNYQMILKRSNKEIENFNTDETQWCHNENIYTIGYSNQDIEKIIEKSDKRSIIFQKLTGSESFSNDLIADGIEYLSKKFIMKKYLQLTNDDILENERMKLEEFGEDPDNYDKSILTKLYAPDSLESGMEDGMGPDMGSDLSGPDMMTPDIETPTADVDTPIE